MGAKTIPTIEDTLESKKDRSTLSLFLLMLPSLIIMMTGYIEQWTLRIGMQILLFILQFVVAKNIVEELYKFS